MARNTEPLDTVLKRLRALTPLSGPRAYTPGTMRAHNALGTAIADWVDAVRIDPEGGYPAVLAGLDLLVNLLPEAPSLQPSDLAEIEAFGEPPRKAIEGPK
jgi:hypothetical protein